MKKISLFLAGLVLIAACNNKPLKVSDIITELQYNNPDTTELTNNFYDNTETFHLPVSDLIIEGEVAKPGKVDFGELPIHSVIVKETLLDSLYGEMFVGAYRYDGYSLFDILNNIIVEKSNSKEFNPNIDLYIEIDNDKGEKVIFSWGEIYYPNNLHKILIAVAVSPIIPSKTGDEWPLPSEAKLVAATDLITERNISSPVKITVKSYPRSFNVDRDIFPFYSGEIDIYSSDKRTGTMKSVPDSLNKSSFNTIFYGRGRGIHTTAPFSGYLLKDLLIKSYPLSKENIQKGLLCIVGKDGYRSAISYSELFNRNDQQEFLLVRYQNDEDGGLYRVFVAADFFSDRAIKAVSEIHLYLPGHNN